MQVCSPVIWRSLMLYRASVDSSKTPTPKRAASRRTSCHSGAATPPLRALEGRRWEGMLQRTFIDVPM